MPDAPASARPLPATGPHEVRTDLMVADIARGNERLITSERNFFGVVKVIENGKPGSAAERRELVHGWISHGLQLREPVLRRLPTSYYTHSSGAARAIALMRAAITTVRP